MFSVLWELYSIGREKTIMGDRGEIVSWTSGITHVVLKQVHDQVGYNALGVMTHTLLCERPG